MRAEYICPVLTAFDENGKVDMEAMKRQFDHLIEGGLNGIAIMGSSGEFYAMTLEEAMAFARDSIAYLKGKIPVYIGTGRLIADETIHIAWFIFTVYKNISIIWNGHNFLRIKKWDQYITRYICFL